MIDIRFGHHPVNIPLTNTLPGLISQKTGILKRLHTLLRGAGEPRLYVAISELTETRRYLNCYGEVSGTGVGLTENQAIMAAVGEAVEGYCSYDIQQEMLLTSHKELVNTDPLAVSPEEFPLYSNAQYQNPEFRFQPFTRNSIIHWIKGRSAISGEIRHLPAALIYISYTPSNNEPRICHTIFGGIASGTSYEAALLSGLYEVVERDAMMIWWLNQLPMPRVFPESGKRLEKIYKKCFSDTKLSFELWKISVDINIPVFFGLVTDSKNQAVAGGFGTSLDPEAAALKALFECVQNRLGQLPMRQAWGRTLYNEKAGRAILDTMVHVNNTQPYISDFSHLTNLNSNLQFYLNPKTHKCLDKIRSSSNEIRLSEIPDQSSQKINEDLSLCLKIIGEKGFDVIVTDLTHEDVAELGFIVLRVSIPGLVPNSVTAWPHLGNHRLYDVPVALGFPLKTESQLVKFPMPYA